MSGDPAAAGGSNGIGSMQPTNTGQLPPSQVRPQPAMANTSMGMGSQPGAKGTPPQSGFAPPFGQLSTANPGNTNTQYPQLTGGPWNQMTQMGAGPGYSPQSQVNPLAAPPTQALPPGQVNIPGVGSIPALQPGQAAGRGGYSNNVPYGGWINNNGYGGWS